MQRSFSGGCQTETMVGTKARQSSISTKSEAQRLELDPYWMKEYFSLDFQCVSSGRWRDICLSGVAEAVYLKEVGKMKGCLEGRSELSGPCFFTLVKTQLSDIRRDPATCIKLLRLLASCCGSDAAAAAGDAPFTESAFTNLPPAALKSQWSIFHYSMANV